MQQDFGAGLDAAEDVQSRLEVLDALAGGLDEEVQGRRGDEEDAGRGEKPLVSGRVPGDMPGRRIHPGRQQDQMRLFGEGSTGRADWVGWCAIEDCR